jgi:hypothetical protein
MTRGRSNAYWAANRYADAAVEPAPDAPLHDLPAAAAARFAALRNGLLALEGAAESVRFMGTSWRWAWEYGVGNRKLCWVHIMGDALSATFTLSDSEEDRFHRAARPAAAIVRAVEEGQRTGPVKWCWLELDDRRAVEAFLRLAARKAEWLAERPAPHRPPKPRPRRDPDDDNIEAE